MINPLPRCRHPFKAPLLCICLALPAPVRAADSVLIENSRLGTSSWQLTNPVAAQPARLAPSPGPK
jgi:hypothetical protein